jgi:glutathione synthase
MTLRVAIQMDPLETVKLDFDTSFALAEAAQERGAQLYEYQPAHLSYGEGRVFARARPVRVQRVPGQPGIFGERVMLDLATDVDVILVRQDPPFDLAYITACHLLELVNRNTLVLNDPAAVRSNPEKLFPLLFPELTPPTLISRDPEAIADFRATHRDVVLKPLYSFGGQGVFRIREDDTNLDALLELVFARTSEPVILQAFLPAVAQGDKRIILVDGELAGGFNRVPATEHVRSNMRVGGTAVPVDMSDADLAIVSAIGPLLRRLGLVLAGIDVIGGRLTEVNVTSPTGVQVLKRFTGVDAAQMFWDAAERRLRERAA